MWIGLRYLLFLLDLQIHLTGHADVYGKIPGDSADGPVNKSTFFDSSMDHLYITTLKKVVTCSWLDAVKVMFSFAAHTFTFNTLYFVFLSDH